MSGQLSNEEQGVIRTNRAQQAQTSGMPGTGMLQNTLHGNATLRDLGIATGERQRQGLSDLNSLMNSYYGNVTPTAGQRLSADVTLAGQDKDVAIQTRKLDEAASQFQQSFGFEEKKLAQQLGLSEKELAYKLAALAADTANQQGDLALRTAELNQNASQFAQNRELAPTDIATLAASPHAPPGTLATLLAKYGAAPNFDQLAATGTGISSSTIGRY